MNNVTCNGKPDKLLQFVYIKWILYTPLSQTTGVIKMAGFLLA